MVFGMSILSFLVIALVLTIIGYAISSLLYMLIFKKAGIDAKKAWIPFYNKWIFFELGGQEGWKSLLAFIPYVGVIISFVFEVLAVIEISKKLGKSPYFAILYPFGILSFGIASLVWFLILGLDSSRWNDIAGKESLAKGTILGYKIVEEEEASDAKEEKTEE
jgi:hypothetical protein